MISSLEMLRRAAERTLENNGMDIAFGFGALGLLGRSSNSAKAVGSAAAQGKVVSASRRAAIDHEVEQRMPAGGMDVNYQVNWVPGPPQHNARLNRALSQAAYMQTEKEHNDALSYYLKRLPRNANAAMVNEAIRKGIMRERELRRFWAGNRTLREYISPSSSAVSEIRIDGANNVIVRFGKNPKRYTYRGGSNPYEAAREAAKLALAPSIGQAVMGSWGKTHKLF